MIIDEIIAPYGRVIVKLLKGPVEEQDSAAWDCILNYQREMMDYLKKIGLELILKRDDGFAYVRQIEDDEGKTIGMVSRQQLGFEVSVVLIVLRQILEEFDSDVSEIYTHDRYITIDELKARIDLFLPEGYNKVKYHNEIVNYVNRIVGLGFMKPMTGENSNSYKIQRIIKEKVTLDSLREFKEKLQEYV